MKANVRRVAMGMAVLLAVACSAQAVVITEADYEAGADLTVVTSPGSPTGTVTGDAVLTRGVLVVSGNADSGARYGVTGSPSLGAQPYFNIVQGASGNWGENTIVAVVRRHNWDNENHTLLAATDVSGQNGIVLGQRANGDVLFVDLYKDGAGLGPGYSWKNPEGWGLAVSTILEPDTDYVVAASWRDRGAANEIDFRIFVRKVSDVPRPEPDYAKVGLLDTTVTNVAVSHVPAGFENMYLYVGRNAAGTEPWDGKIGRVEILNQYTETEEQFDALFDTYAESMAPDYDPLVWMDITFDSGLTMDRVYRDANVPPASGEGVLRGGATLSGGRLVVPSTSFSGAVYDHRDSLWRGAAHYMNVDDFVNWGSNTIVAVAKRDTTDTTRHPLFCVGPYSTYDNRDGLMFMQDGGVILLNIYSNWDYVNVRMIPEPNTPPDPLLTDTALLGGRDYFLAASWRDNGDETIDMSIYQREVSDAVGTTVKYKVQLDKPYALGENPPVWNWHLPADLYMQLLVIGCRTVTNEKWMGNVDRIMVLGEFNETQADYEALYEYVVQGEPRDCADVWNEGYGIDGDLNRDCRVDLGDMAYAAGEWLADDCAIFYNCLDADVDGSGAVGLGDASTLAEDWLRCNVPGQAGCEAPW